MPSPDAILITLARTANDWRWLAVVWHGLLAALVVVLAGGWRPPAQVAGCLLVSPLLSVGWLAWLEGNPFNGTAFLALAAVSTRAAFRLPVAPLRLGPPPWIARGASMVAFGAVYPHFLQTDSWAAYAVASPFGLVPCPTLSVVIGMTLAIPDLRSGTWGAWLLLAGLFYAAVGVLGLGVSLDWGLFIGTAMLGASLADQGPVWRSVRAKPSERSRFLAGDDLIADPLGAFTHAITIRRPPQEVWPWLAQMGAGSRAGWYSYDRLDNGGRPSATRLVPELQAPAIGTVFPALPGVKEGFTVVAIEPPATLVLGWRGPEGALQVSRAFVLEPGPDGTTRLVVRVRGARHYRFHGLPPAVSKPIVRLVHFVMQRRQLLGIARRAESAEAADELLDRFMPVYDVVERHRIAVAAPAETTLRAAGEQDLLRVPLIRAVFRAREIAMRGDPGPSAPRGLLAMTRALGWGVLADAPGREIVMGAVTKPWEANVTFRAVAPAEFAAFAQPGFVKVVWTLRADPVDAGRSIFRTETRAVATDTYARARFRRYWRLVSPGIALIRRLSLQPLRREAERRAKGGAILAAH